jgi:DNA-binding NtrC family response regulator
MDVRFSQAAQEAMQRYDWPGNVRQLRNIINRFSVLNLGETVQATDVEEVIYRGGVPESSIAESQSAKTPQRFIQDQTSSHIQLEQNHKLIEQNPTQTMADMERTHIEQALASHANNKTRAAESLSISRSTLIRKLKSFK